MSTPTKPVSTENALQSYVASHRMRVLILGSAAGLMLCIAGIVMAWKWWDTFAGGWTVWQGPDGARVWVSILTLALGLGAVFLSLQLARPDEHASPVLRRTLYGYNTVLTGLLLFGILIGVNVLAYTSIGPFAYLNKDYRWAAMSIYSLSSKSEKILESLAKPTKVIVIMPSGDLFYSLRGLLDNCREVNNTLEVEYLSPERDAQRVQELSHQYHFGLPVGLLVLYGDDHRFIKVEDLVGAPDFRDHSKATLFKGESALMTELSYLVEGKVKPVIYFTQGNGELDITDTRPTQRIDEGLGLLKQRLEAGNYTVKGLQLSPVEIPSKPADVVVIVKEVPKDASLVVVARPRGRWPEHALKALKAYLSDQKNKLIVLFDVTTGPDGKMETTGLEELVADYGVQVGANHIVSALSYQNRTPVDVLVATPPRADERTNPLAVAFRGIGIFLHDVRTVKHAGPTEAERHRVEVLLETPVRQPAQYLWAESNLGDPDTLIKKLDREGKLQQQISLVPLSVAVTVTESIPDSGSMQAVSKPRLVVFGDATLLCNRFMTQQEGANIHYDLFANCLGWLRESPVGIGIEPKRADVFLLNPRTNVNRMVLLPGLLTFFGIVGLGAGVWIVRRR